jgi:hypothetical protein
MLLATTSAYIIVFQINIRVVLELFEVRCREKRQPVAFELPAGEHVHHLHKCPVRHHRVVGARLYEMIVNLMVCPIFQGNGYVLTRSHSNAYTVKVPAASTIAD